MKDTMTAAERKTAALIKRIAQADASRRAAALTRIVDAERREAARGEPDRA